MSSNSKLKALVATVSEKGGPGKSTATKAIVNHLRVNGVEVAVFDGDGTVGDTFVSLGARDGSGKLLPDQDPRKGVTHYDFRIEPAHFLNSVACGAPVVFHDLPGGSLDLKQRIVDAGDGVEGLVGALEREGYRLLFLHLISNHLAAATSVGRYLELFGAHADHIAVKNAHYGRSPSDFPFWVGFVDGKGESKGGKARAKLLELGGTEIVLPALPSSTFAKVEALNVPYDQAVDAPELTITERAHVHKFLKEFAAEFKPAAKFFGM